MAKRPVFIAKRIYPYYEIQEVEFDFYSGYAISQKQKSINSLHERFIENYQGMRIIEISTKSTEKSGVNLSAFNLQVQIAGKKTSIECAFQGSKKFEKGGPYTDIYDMNPWEAKKDPRLRESGNIIEFILNDYQFGNEPKDYFYNWIYIKALHEQGEYLEQLKKYSAFTDIEFNPKKSFNCQAKANAIAVGLMQAGRLEKCMSDKDVFLETVYKESNVTYEQIDIFSMVV